MFLRILKILLTIGTLLFLYSVPIYSIELIQVDKFEKDEIIRGPLFKADVNQQGELITMFFKSGVKITSKDHHYDLGPIGEGPGDIHSWASFTLKGDYLTEIENYRKMQIFKRINNKYTYQDTFWREEKKFHQFIKSSILFNEKYYLGGWVHSIEHPENMENYWVRIIDKKGRFKKNLIKFPSQQKRYNLIQSYLALLDDKILFILESSPKLFIISTKKNFVSEKAELNMPEFYVSMPDDFFSFTEKRPTTQSFERLFYQWRRGYSRIMGLVVHGSKILVQIRTCQKNKKSFVLLFYNSKTYSLENTYFTNDMLLTSKDGRLFLLKKGNPGVDDDAGEMVVSICKVQF